MKRLGKTVARILALCAVLFLSSLNSETASAQTCNGSFNDLSFGTVNLLDNTPDDTSFPYNVTCSGTAGQVVYACPSFGAGSGGANGSNSPRYLVSGGNQLGFNLFTDAARTDVWGSSAGGGSIPRLSVTIGAGGTGTVGGTLYGRIYTGQPTVPTGGYASLFEGIPNAYVTATTDSGQDCASLGTAGANSFRVNVMASYIATCTVDVDGMAFGTINSTTMPTDATATVTATCSATSPYSISVGDGSHSTGAQQRRIGFGGNFVSYGLYKDVARTQIWGDTLATRVEAIGAGNAQNFTIYGRIPAQATPFPGTYIDTVIVTVSF